MRNKTQEKALAFTRKRDPDLLYRFSEEGVMRKVEILEEEVEGKAVKLYLEELETTKADLLALENRVGYFVRNAGVKTLEEVVVISPKKEYVVAHTAKEGVIVDISPISREAAILVGEPIPKGIEFGYHKIEGNKIVEDVILKHSIYRLM